MIYSKHSIFTFGLFNIFLILATMSCGLKTRDETPKLPQSTPPQEERNPESYFKARIQPHPEPNRYSIALSWADNVGVDEWMIYRKSSQENDNEIQIAGLESHVSTYIDADIKSQTTYSYQLKTQIAGELITRQRIDVYVPRDLVISGEKHLFEIKGVNRLFLGRDSTLKTNGQDICIKANEVISDGGTIDTSPVPRTRLPGQNGQSCGKIVLSAKRAKGFLYLFSHAEDGTIGEDGKNGAPGAAGKPGTSGDWDIKPEMRASYLPWKVEGIERSLRTRPDWYPPGHKDWGFWCYCKVHPSNGGKGDTGVNGTDGQNGGNGGHAPNVHIEIEEESDFEVTFDLLSGQGAEGGLGGNGGLGGPGGPPGKLDDGHLGKPATQGPQGDRGRNGREGKCGQPGAYHPLLIKIGSKTVHAYDDSKE